MKKSLFLASAILALVLVPALSMAQENQAVEDGVFDDIPVMEFANSGDPGFDKLVDWDLASRAATSSDPVGLTDVALQLAYAERRILFRPHRTFDVSALFQLALRAAAAEGDQDTLERLALGTKQYGLDAIADEAEAAIELASAARSSFENRENVAVGKLFAIVSQLTDGEISQFLTLQNRIAASFGTPEELEQVKAFLVESQELAKVVRDYLVAELDNRIERFSALTADEQEALIRLASITGQRIVPF